MLVKLKSTSTPNLNTRIPKSTIITPFWFPIPPPILIEKLVRKKSLTTPSGKAHEIRLPKTPPMIAPKNNPITISDISLFLMFYVLVFERILFFWLWISQLIIFQPINETAIGKSKTPRDHIIPNEEIINNDKAIVLDLPDLNDKSGNFIKCIGLTIKILKAETSIKATLGSP